MSRPETGQYHAPGLTLEEAAQALDIAEPTARRWWAYARASLLKEMGAAQS